MLDVINHDVRRLDRLISDISDASRLDAELARSEAQPFDLSKLVSAVVEVANSVRSGDDIETILKVTDHPLGAAAYRIIGHDSRIGQVINNLIDNAKSFSKESCSVTIYLIRVFESIEIKIEDQGPGIPEHALEKIFDRFYTDRPNHGFGQNSGLGLSISRQIINAHRGAIWAENIMKADDDTRYTNIVGARFVIRLPAAD